MGWKLSCYNLFLWIVHYNLEQFREVFEGILFLCFLVFWFTRRMRREFYKMSLLVIAGLSFFYCSTVEAKSVLEKCLLPNIAKLGKQLHITFKFLNVIIKTFIRSLLITHQQAELSFRSVVIEFAMYLLSRVPEKMFVGTGASVNTWVRRLRHVVRPLWFCFLVEKTVTNKRTGLKMGWTWNLSQGH